MKIDDRFLLPIGNFIKVESIKKKIIIGDTFNHDMQHVISWTHRYNGEYKKTAPFTIGKDGVIYKHFNPKYQSLYFNDLDLDKNSILILLENDGWLIKNEEQNNFISWLGYIYNGEDIFNRGWKGYNYWCGYSEKQMVSLIFLVRKLSKEFFIPLNAMRHNTKVEEIDDSIGIVYKSNLKSYYTDLNPSFDFEYFANNINIKIE